jgi:hypothetical protein
MIEKKSKIAGRPVYVISEEIKVGCKAGAKGRL